MGVVGDGIQQLLFPHYCAGCGKPGETLCPNCSRHLAGPPRRIKTRVFTAQPVWSLAPYSGPVADAIVHYKEHHLRALAPFLGRALARGIVALIDQGEILGPHYRPLVLLPAPLTAASIQERGFAHLPELAHYCAQILAQFYQPHNPQYPVVVADLLRIAAHPDSVGLTATQRQEALAGKISVRQLVQNDEIFGTNPRCYHTPEAILIDDIVTTGATIAECFTPLYSLDLRLRGALTLASA